MNTGTIPFKLYRPLALNASGDGVAVTTLSATFTMTAADEQYQALNGGASNRNVVLPTADPEIKGVAYFIANAGTTNALAILDGATVIATVNYGGHIMVACTGAEWKVLNQKMGPVATVADSASVTGSGPTAYDKTVTIPASYLTPGKTIRVHGCVRSTGLNASDTKTITVFVGTTVFLTSTAAIAASGARCVFELTLTARAAVGAAASCVAFGYSAWSTAANAPAYGGDIQNLATNGALAVSAKVADSSASAGNTSVLESLVVEFI